MHDQLACFSDGDMKLAGSYASLMILFKGQKKVNWRFSLPELESFYIQMRVGYECEELSWNAFGVP